jgi:hypothetical protein
MVASSRKCPNCNSPIGPGDIHCGVCGALIDEDSTKIITSTSGSSGLIPLRKVIRGVAGAGLGGLIVGSLLTFLLLSILSPGHLNDSIVTNLMDQDVNAAKSHDVGSLPQIYAYNAVVVDAGCQSSSPSSVWSGLPQITARYEGLPPFTLLAHVNVHVSWIPDNSSATQATATADTSGIALVNGSSISLRGHELWTFAKIDGQWRITSFTYNLC